MSSYNPIPPRVWSRVQNPCTFVNPDDQYLSSYIPLTGQTVSQAQADYEMKQLYKGNILQYKGNSARLTKSQKYSQLARCSGPNRTKVFATQSEKYTNPNTTWLLRQNFITYPFPNEIVGVPNNISGPFGYNNQNPNNCPGGSSIQDGGTLVCGTYVNPCSGEIIKKSKTSPIICNPASASNVPGSSILCWNNKAQTWFPKQRYVMNNSTDKWPINYKGLVSALTCSNSQPKLVFQGFNNNNINNITIRNAELNSIFNDELILDEDTINIYKDIINSDINITATELEKMGLTDTDLANMGLTVSDLENTNLTATDLENMGLTATDLENMGLTATDLENMGLTVTDLENMGLTATDLENMGSLNNNFINTDVTSRDIISYNFTLDLKPNSIFRVDSFNIYIDGKFYRNVVNNETYRYTITNINKLSCVITITSVTNGVESPASEPILVKYTPVDRSPLPPVEENYTCELIDICRKMDEKFALLNASITNVYSSTTNISDKLAEFEILKALLNSEPIKLISEFIEKYIGIMYDDSTYEYIPIDTYNELKADLLYLEEILINNPELIMTELLTKSNIKNIVLKSKSKDSTIQTTNKNQFLSPDSLKMGQIFLDNYKEILSLIKSAFDKKNLALSAIIESEDWKKDSDILNNADKLREYVENLNKTISLFKLGIQSIAVELKQQYIIYHNLYGVPANLEYDPVLMKPILEELGLFNSPM
jgi:hypothetical protein